MQIRLRLFASLRDAVETPEISLELPAGARVVDLVGAVTKRLPTLERRLDAVMVAVNHAVVPRDTSLGEGDVVALIPPMSGG